MKILKLEGRNFQSHKHVEMEPNGADMVVSAENGVGKTTLMSMFCFCLWGKDSQGKEPEGKAGFRIKPLAGGEPVHNLVTEVTMILEIGDDHIALTRTFREDWRTIRGGNKKEMKGHEQGFTVDGVPKNATQYDQIVASLCPGGKAELLRILCQATAFNDTLTWQERRAYLVELTGDISDADVIASSEALKPLTAVLGKRTVEDCREVLKADRKKAQERLRDLPARIDEHTRGLGA